MQNGKTMLDSPKFRQNFHPVWAKMMANLFRRGIPVRYIPMAQMPLTFLLNLSQKVVPEPFLQRQEVIFLG